MAATAGVAAGRLFAREALATARELLWCAKNCCGPWRAICGATDTRPRAPGFTERREALEPGNNPSFDGFELRIRNQLGVQHFARLPKPAR